MSVSIFTYNYLTFRCNNALQVSKEKCL